MHGRTNSFSLLIVTNRPNHMLTFRASDLDLRVALEPIPFIYNLDVKCDYEGRIEIVISCSPQRKRSQLSMFYDTKVTSQLHNPTISTRASEIEFNTSLGAG